VLATKSEAVELSPRCFAETAADGLKEDRGPAAYVARGDKGRAW
jgi:hypothetical protein